MLLSMLLKLLIIDEEHLLNDDRVLYTEHIKIRADRSRSCDFLTNVRDILSKMLV
ncbi:hypothetical protein CASFOL_009140 [Castilleja foliolosa]|uniref:Uncharacterized protein n=1 Tax=Castilleja foliolosa TaxID=1961234 RepID=A0ABD3DXV9_9LAMI